MKNARGAPSPAGGLLHAAADIGTKLGAEIGPVEHHAGKIAKVFGRLLGLLLAADTQVSAGTDGNAGSATAERDRAGDGLEAEEADEADDGRSPPAGGSRARHRAQNAK